MLLPPTPLSLLCAILLCFPLAAIFSFTTTTTTTNSPGGAATSSPLVVPFENSFSSKAAEKKISEPVLLPPRLIKPITTKNRTTAAPAALQPPPASQLAGAEDENDDVSLLKLASRVNSGPKPGKKLKLAFMFLTTSPLPFAPLWELYFSRAPKSLYNVYVHADPSVKNYTPPFRGVFAGRVVPSKPTRRHTPTLISAARRLLAHALLHDESNAMFALLSPSCVPIRPFGYAHRVLTRRPRRSFVEILKNEAGAYDRWAARGEEAMAPEVQFEDFRIGSQFWVVSRRHARAIVGDTRLWSKFRLPCLEDSTCYPEEHYFPTLLSMVDPRGCIPCTLTHVDWRGGHGGHPRMYNGSEVGPDLIRALRKRRPRYGDDEEEEIISDGSNSSVTVSGNNNYKKKRHDPFLFARKFEPASLHNLMSIANNVIFKD